jgi:hypothetical protein
MHEYVITGGGIVGLQLVYAAIAMISVGYSKCDSRRASYAWKSLMSVRTETLIAGRVAFDLRIDNLLE